MDTSSDPIEPLLQAATSRHAERGAVLGALDAFADTLYRAAEQLTGELALRKAPGVAVARRIPVARTPWLRLQWLGMHLAFVPHDEVAFPPESYQLDLRGRVGRVLLFHTPRADDTGGRVLRDYLVDADGRWHYRGIAGAGVAGPLDDVAARDHVAQLLADLHTHLREVWFEGAQATTFDESEGGRSIGFHVDHSPGADD